MAEGFYSMNMNTLVVVVDAARARLFQLAASTAPRAPVELRETESVVNPEARIKQSERYNGSHAMGTRTGRSGRGGQEHVVGDHRAQHDAEDLRRFAKLVAESVARSARENVKNPVLLVATHPMHAVVKSELERELPREVYLRSQVGELTDLGGPQLLEALQERGMFAP
jgi:protein required for attachment to host cells